MVYRCIGPSQCFCFYEIIDGLSSKFLADRLCRHFVRAAGQARSQNQNSDISAFILCHLIIPCFEGLEKLYRF